MTSRILFISGREAGYIRNRVLVNALRKHYDVTVLTGKGNSILTRTITGLTRFARERPQYDIVFLGFYAQPLVIILSIVQKKPIIFDAYVSTFDTLCSDRGWFRPNSIMGRLALWLDRYSCSVASCILTDTKANADYFRTVMDIQESKIKPVYVGCDNSIFYPRPQTTNDDGWLNIFYYGSFLRLHGTEIIIQAASQLQDMHEIRFVLGGEGKQLLFIRDMISRLNLKNVALVGWIPFEKLPEYISRSTICLGGHFSTVQKATRVISTKTFQFMAMRKPTIIADNPATRELFISGEHAYSIPMGDPRALAEAIKILIKDNDLRQRIAEGGYQIIHQRLSLESMARDLDNFIKQSCLV